jgi:hypothetical protein
MILSRRNIILLLIVFCFSCNNDHLLINKETEILNDIFLQNVSDNFFFPMSPIPPPVNTRESGNKRIDSLDKEIKKNYEYFISRADLNKHVISIEDSTDLMIDHEVLIDNLKTYGYKDLANIACDNLVIPIEIGKITNTGKYTLIKRSEHFPKGFNFKKYNGIDLPFYYYGNISFSKPTLNDSSNFGYIIYKRECGFECDRENILIIRKQNNRWTIIDKLYAR